jgi:hypothetical protein
MEQPMIENTHLMKMGDANPNLQKPLPLSENPNKADQDPNGDGQRGNSATLTNSTE